MPIRYSATNPFTEVYTLIIRNETKGFDIDSNETSLLEQRMTDEEYEVLARVRHRLSHAITY